MVSEGSGMLVMASNSFKQIITEDFPVSVKKNRFLFTFDVHNWLLSAVL